MGTVPSTFTAVVNAVFTAAEWNTYERDAIAFFVSPPRVQAYADTTATSIADDGAYHPVALGQETAGTGFDSDGMHSTVSQQSRLTCVTPGTYLFDGGVSFVSNGASVGSRIARWMLNGAAVGPIGRITSPSTSVPTTVNAPSWGIVLVAGDYVELGAVQTSGTTLLTSVASPTYSYANALWIGS